MAQTLARDLWPADGFANQGVPRPIDVTFRRPITAVSAAARLVPLPKSSFVDGRLPEIISENVSLSSAWPEGLVLQHAVARRGGSELHGRTAARKIRASWNHFGC